MPEHVLPDVRAILDAYRRASFYKPNLVDIGKKSADAKEPDLEDYELFVAEIETVVRRHGNPRVAEIIARGAPRIWDAIRMTNNNTGAGYKGAAARGPELVANPIEPRDTGSGGGNVGTSPLVAWYLSVTSVADRRLYPATGTVDLTISSLPVLSHVILGWQDDVRRPKASVVQLVLDSDAWAQEVLDFNLRADVDDVPVYELKQPWLIRPGASYRVSVRHYITGDDYLQPIGFTVKRAQDIIAGLAT